GRSWDVGVHGGVLVGVVAEDGAVDRRAGGVDGGGGIWGDRDRVYRGAAWSDDPGGGGGVHGQCAGAAAVDRRDGAGVARHGGGAGGAGGCEGAGGGLSVVWVQHDGAERNALPGVRAEVHGG